MCLEDKLKKASGILKKKKNHPNHLIGLLMDFPSTFSDQLTCVLAPAAREKLGGRAPEASKQPQIRPLSPHSERWAHLSGVSIPMGIGLSPARDPYSPEFALLFPLQPFTWCWILCLENRKLGEPQTPPPKELAVELGRQDPCGRKYTVLACVGFGPDGACSR